MRILITGGAGFLGSRLSSYLWDKGHTVFTYDKYLYGQPVSPYHLNNLYDDVDAVVHLAAIVGDEACELDRENTRLTNVEFTKQIHEMYKGKKIVFASTCSVYGDSKGEIATEGSVLNPLSYYAETKIEAERALERDAVILRFGTLFGVSPRMRYDLVVNTMTVRAVQDKKITVKGGDQWRPLLAIEDACRAIEEALSWDNGIYNIPGTNYQIKQIAELIKEELPDTEIVTEDATDPRNYMVASKFQPHVTLKEGIKNIIEVAKDADLSDERYSNYLWLKNGMTG